MKKLKDRRLEHIKNVIQPRDVEQFIRTCYLNRNWDEGLITNEQFGEYIHRIRARVFENWYTEEDLQQVIADAKDIAADLDGLTINFN